MNNQRNTTDEKQTKKINGKKRRLESIPDTASLNKRPKRVPKKPDRFGKRLSAVNRNEFFEQFSHNEIQLESEKTNTFEGSDDSSVSYQPNNSGNTSSNDGLNQINNFVSDDDSIQSTKNSSTVSVHERSDILEEKSSHSDIDRSDFQSIVISKLDEILKRIAYVEKDCCKTQVRLNKLERNFEQYFERINGGGIDVLEAVSEADRETFGVPISSKVALDKFEKNLTSPDFKSKLVIFIYIMIENEINKIIYGLNLHVFKCVLNQVAALKRIGGTTGNANGKKVLRSIVAGVISPEFMSTITWTGKTSGGKIGKIKFESYKHTTQLISDLCIAADKSFNEQLVLKQLKYSILKYAHTRSTSTSTSTASTSVTPSSSPAPTELSTGSENSTNTTIDVEPAEQKSLGQQKINQEQIAASHQLLQLQQQPHQFQQPPQHHQYHLPHQNYSYTYPHYDSNNWQQHNYDYTYTSL